MKKILSLFLVLVLSLGLLAGCGGNKKDDTNTPTASADEGIFSTADVKFINENNESVYRIVRPADLEFDATQAAIVFKNAKTVLGVTLKNIDDATDGADVYEILVGNTNRPETAKAKDYLIASAGGHRDDYIIASIDKKIVIYGMSEDALKNGVEYFCKNLIKTEGVAGGIKHVNKTSGDFKAITVNNANFAYFKIVRPHYNLSHIVQLQIDELCKTAKETYAYELNYYEDAYVTEGDYEIVIGNCNRANVPAVTNVDQYVITISGKKVYLNGGSISATAMAIAEFTKMMANGKLADKNSVSSDYTTAVASYDKSKYYTLAWGDDFEGDAIDSTLWYHVPESQYYSNGMNGRKSVRSTNPAHVFVSDGKFTINAGYDDQHYYGGMLMTDRTMLYKYGYLEMSAILPDGDGLWTSLWLDSRWHGFDEQTEAGKYYDFEIDVNECFGKSTVVQANCHKWPTSLGEQEGYEHTSLDLPEYSNAKRRTALDGGNFNQEFHTFGMLWNEEVMSFTCDGVVYFTYKINETAEDLDGFHTLAYIRLSAAIGYANNPRGVVLDDADEKWYTSNKFIIDYVHLYQLDDNVQQLVLNGEMQ